MSSSNYRKPNRYKECSIQSKRQKQSSSRDIYHVFTNNSNKFHIKQYELGHLLGEGGFATCYSAKRITDGRMFAVKIIALTDKKELGYQHHKDNHYHKGSKRTGKMTTLEKANYETRVLKSCTHPNIIGYETDFVYEGSFHIVMELCKMGSFGDMLKKRKGPISQVQARHYLVQIVQGLIYLKSRKIIHRDLKPGNYLLTQNHQLKIADFGLATFMDSTFPARQSTCGTPNYISPQMILKKDYGYEVDLWAVGVVLYSMLYGIPPFETKNRQAKETYEMIRRCEYRLSDSAASEQANDLIRKILVLDPKRRIPLEKILEHKFINNVDIPSFLKIKAPKSSYISRFQNRRVDSNNKLQYYSSKNISQISGTSSETSTVRSNQKPIPPRIKILSPSVQFSAEQPNICSNHKYAQDSQIHINQDILTKKQRLDHKKEQMFPLQKLKYKQHYMSAFHQNQPSVISQSIKKYQTSQVLTSSPVSSNSSSKNNLGTQNKRPQYLQLDKCNQQSKQYDKNPQFSDSKSSSSFSKNYNNEQSKSHASNYLQIYDQISNLASVQFVKITSNRQINDTNKIGYVKQRSKKKNCNKLISDYKFFNNHSRKTIQKRSKSTNPKIPSQKYSRYYQDKYERRFEKMDVQQQKINNSKMDIEYNSSKQSSKIDCQQKQTYGTNNKSLSNPIKQCIQEHKFTDFQPLIYPLQPQFTTQYIKNTFNQAETQSIKDRKSQRSFPVDVYCVWDFILYSQSIYESRQGCCLKLVYCLKKQTSFDSKFDKNQNPTTSNNNSTQKYVIGIIFSDRSSMLLQITSNIQNYSKQKRYIYIPYLKDSIDHYENEQLQMNLNQQHQSQCETRSKHSKSNYVPIILSDRYFNKKSGQKSNSKFSPIPNDITWKRIIAKNMYQWFEIQIENELNKSRNNMKVENNDCFKNSLMMDEKQNQVSNINTVPSQENESKLQSFTKHQFTCIKMFKVEDRGRKLYFQMNNGSKHYMQYDKPKTNGFQPFQQRIESNFRGNNYYHTIYFLSQRVGFVKRPNSHHIQRLSSQQFNSNKQLSSDMVDQQVKFSQSKMLTKICLSFRNTMEHFYKRQKQLVHAKMICTKSKDHANLKIIEDIEQEAMKTNTEYCIVNGELRRNREKL